MSDVDLASFRQAAGQFTGGIVVVTTAAGAAMTVSSFTSVSLEPPLVLFCADKTAAFHDAVIAAGAWAVSILAEDAQPEARPLEAAAHHPGPVTGAPVLDGALAYLECRTTAVHDGGDHSIILGQVDAASVPARRSSGRPLVHYAGRYRRLRLRG